MAEEYVKIDKLYFDGWFYSNGIEFIEYTSIFKKVTVNNMVAYYLLFPAIETRVNNKALMRNTMNPYVLYISYLVKCLMEDDEFVEYEQRTRKITGKIRNRDAILVQKRTLTKYLKDVSVLKNPKFFADHVDKLFTNFQFQKRELFQAINGQKKRNAWVQDFLKDVSEEEESEESFGPKPEPKVNLADVRADLLGDVKGDLNNDFQVLSERSEPSESGSSHLGDFTEFNDSDLSLGIDPRFIQESIQKLVITPRKKKI